MKIYYGVPYFYKDITELCYTKCLKDKEILTFPNEDIKRSELFGDPIYGVRKHILVILENRVKIFRENDLFCLFLQDFYNHAIDLINPYDYSFDQTKINNHKNIEYMKYPYLFFKNDFKKIEDKIEFDTILLKNGYICILNESFYDHDKKECELLYFQIWKKNI